MLTTILEKQQVIFFVYIIMHFQPSKNIKKNYMMDMYKDTIG